MVRSQPNGTTEELPAFAEEEEGRARSTRCPSVATLPCHALASGRARAAPTAKSPAFAHRTRPPKGPWVRYPIGAALSSDTTTRNSLQSGVRSRCFAAQADHPNPEEDPSIGSPRQVVALLRNGGRNRRNTQSWGYKVRD